LLIILGLIGCVLILKEKNNWQIAVTSVIYFFILYFLICFGTGPDFRNIEMRYFIPADVLLLITAAVSLKTISKKIQTFVRT